MWSRSFLCGPKKKKWEIEDLEAKPSYDFCETAGKLCFGEFLAGQQCSGTRGLDLLQHRMCSLKEWIQVQCFGIFHSRLFLHHCNRTESPAFFQESEGKRWPSCGKLHSDLSQSCEGVRPWVGLFAIRNCKNSFIEHCWLFLWQFRGMFFCISFCTLTLLCCV